MDNQQEMTAKDWLAAEFMRCQSRNPRFSKRMFARQIGVSSGRLSELMSGKRRMTADIAHRISGRLLLPPQERKALLGCVGDEKPTATSQTIPYEQMNADAFHTLADWQHFAIYNLMETDDFKPDFDWIAKRLNITITQASEAVERLKRLNLILERDGQWIKRSANISTTTDVESQALKISHRQSLEQVFEALDQVPIDLRDITSITMAVDMSRLAEAKNLIRKFRRELCAYLEAGPKRDEVYNLNVQLVPVSVLEEMKRRAK